jgi:hypothetical protein
MVVSNICKTQLKYGLGGQPDICQGRKLLLQAESMDLKHVISSMVPKMGTIYKCTISPICHDLAY